VCAANSQRDTPLVWTSLIVLSALGMALYGPVVLAEKTSDAGGAGGGGEALSPRPPHTLRNFLCISASDRSSELVPVQTIVPFSRM
jgi:hypothetical protein